MQLCSSDRAEVVRAKVREHWCDALLREIDAIPQTSINYQRWLRVRAIVVKAKLSSGDLQRYAAAVRAGEQPENSG